MDYSILDTEKTNARTEALDRLSAYEIAQLMNELDAGALTAVREALLPISQTAEEAAKRIPEGGRIIYLGAGTSGRLGVLDASECPPTFGVDSSMVVGIIAGGDGALRNAIEGAEDDSNLAKSDLDKLSVNAKDVVIAISASGTAPYCIGALERAKEVGALAVSMCCNKNTKLSGYADIAIEMQTGPEVLSGSTRLRAGTATKLALNMISTSTMVLMGKVYKNLMVDVRATNTKLRDRSVRIAMKAMNVEREEAVRRLQEADGNIKCAIVMKETGMDLESAKEALKKTNGHVTRLIETFKNGK